VIVNKQLFFCIKILDAKRSNCLVNLSLRENTEREMKRER